MRTLALVCLALVAGCGGGNGNGDAADAAVDAAVPYDLIIPEPPDDLLGGDLRGDLSRPDLLGICGIPGTPCCPNQLCMIGCCDPMQRCEGVGDNCTDGVVCTKSGSCMPCGQLGQPCCGGAPVCEGGGCCDTIGCAGSGSAAATDGTKVCSNGTFLACGGDGQSCCAGSGCAAMGCCSDNRCAATGNTCATAGICIGQTQSCGSCGGLGQSCCRGAPVGGDAADYCTAAGLGCDKNGSCVACGAPGQPCCDGNQCAGGGCCDHSSNLCVAANAACGANQGICSNGGCGDGKCGLAGQTACAGGVGCTGPLVVQVNGNCFQCGALGAGCCDGHGGHFCAPPFACNKTLAKCQLCGGDGSACCQGSLCPGSKNMECTTDVCQ